MAAYTWQADDRAIAAATRDILKLLFLARPGVRPMLWVFAASLAVVVGLSPVVGTFPTKQIAFVGVALAVAFAAMWHQSRTMANALFGDRVTWTVTYGADQLTLETPEGRATFGYADLTRHATSGSIHSWTLSRRRRLFVPAALVPVEALAWISSGHGPEAPGPQA